MFVESTAVQWWWPGSPLLRGYYEEDRSHTLPRAVDWAEGACWLVRRTPFTQIDGFDLRFFMYFEELDAALRLHRAAGPSAIHRTHGSYTSAVKARTRPTCGTSTFTGANTSSFVRVGHHRRGHTTRLYRADGGRPVGRAGTEVAAAGCVSTGRHRLGGPPPPCASSGNPLAHADLARHRPLAARTEAWRAGG